MFRVVGFNLIGKFWKYWLPDIWKNSLIWWTVTKIFWLTGNPILPVIEIVTGDELDVKKILSEWHLDIENYFLIRGTCWKNMKYKNG